LRIVRSRLGWLLAATYVAVFIAAYFDAMAKRGTWLYDIGLDFLALPYIAVVGRLLLQDPTFELHASEPWGLVPAVVFCSGLLLLLGAAIESAARHAWRGIRSRSAGSERQ
jgi:hypothetical protein